MNSSKVVKKVLDKNDCKYTFKDGCNSTLLTEQFFGKEVWIDSGSCFHKAMVINVIPNGHVTVIDAVNNIVLEKEMFYA